VSWGMWGANGKRGLALTPPARPKPLRRGEGPALSPGEREEHQAPLRASRARRIPPPRRPLDRQVPNLRTRPSLQTRRDVPPSPTLVGEGWGEGKSAIAWKFTVPKARRKFGAICLFVSTCWLLNVAAAAPISRGPVTSNPTLTTSGPDASPAFHLLTVGQVDGTGVFLSQIATGTGFELGAVPIRVADAPLFGRVGLLTRDQVQAALRSVRPDLDSARWTGADSIRLTRRSRLLPESEVRDMLTATLQRDAVKDRGELSLRLARPWTSVSVPDEPLILNVLDLPTAGVSQHFIVRFELVAGNEHLGPWQAVLQARIMRDILVAVAPTRRGQILEASDVAIERRDTLALREPLDASVLRSGALEWIDPVPIGQPVLGRSLRPRPVVQRGMMVDGLVRDGSLNILLKVEVLADGLPGQMVRVRNPKTKREFYAKVKDEQTVVISL